jgi:hypothetical protein
MSVTLERGAALLDVQRIVHEYGTQLSIRLRTEANVTRDLYNSVADWPTDRTLAFKANPVVHNPNDRQIERAGLREKSQCIVYTATKDWTDAGLAFKDIDPERTTIVLDARRYRVVERGQTDVFAGAALYITFGLVRL